MEAEIRGAERPLIVAQLFGEARPGGLQRGFTPGDHVFEQGRELVVEKLAQGLEGSCFSFDASEPCQALLQVFNNQTHGKEGF